MNPLSSAQIRGTWGTVLLPVNADESIDYVCLADEVAKICAGGLHGLYTNGTAGEFLSLTEEEFDRTSVLVAEAAERFGLPFQLGASHSSPQLSLERIRRARALAPGAIQIILPDWQRVNNDEAVAFLSRAAEVAEGIPLVLYNPPHAKRVLEPADLAKLRAAVPALAGIKVGDGAASWYGEMRRQLPDFSVFVPGHHYATGRLNGAHGSYSNMACLSPAGARWWDDLIGRDPLAALAMERRILDFFRAHFAPLAAQGFGGGAIDKLLCALGGWCGVGLRLRWPYRSLDEATLTRLKPLVRSALPEFFP
jgi:dihydrodipicolinate synthase/N-acetylneuraminate lyase